MPAEPCPSPEQFDDLRSNRLAEAQAEALRRHISGCPDCQARVRGEAPGKPVYPFLSPPQEPGELGRLAQNRILGVLGEGAMAIVFEAEDTQLHRRVALKVLRPGINDPVAQKRFLREGRLLAGLPHEHIVTVFQVGEVNGVPYLTLEKLEGESLERRLERDRWLPLGEALSLAREAAEGLTVAHEKGLVHRDVKPGNIWLESRNGRFLRVKLIDFGVARQVVGSDLTVAGVALGTPMYVAPEQAAGRTVDARADIYSLGCVLYQMLTGKPVFAGKGGETIKLLQAAAAGEVPNVQKSAPQLPRGVAQLIQEMLSANPDGRPPSARAVVERLRRLEEGELDLVPPPPPSPSASHRRGPRNPGAVGIWIGVGAIAAALLVSVVAAYYKFVPGPAPDGEGEGKTPAGTPIKVGILHSQTGDLSVHERPVIKAVQMALDEINGAGGVMGRPAEFVVEDGASSEDEFALRARKLIEEDGAEVLFGCWTSSSRKRVREVCEEKGCLLFYPGVHEGLEESPNVVYLGGAPNQTLLPLVRWAYAEKRCSRFFFVGSEDLYCHAAAEILAHEVRELKGTLVGTRFIRSREATFADVVEEIKQGKPQMLLAALDGAANVGLCLAMRRAGFTPKDLPAVWLSVTEGELSQFRSEDVAGDYSVACYFETVGRPENVEFLKRFRKRFGPSERVNDAMQTAYFGVHLWKKAAEEAGTTETAAVRKALRGLTVDAPEGQVRIGPTLHAYRHSLVGRIEKEPDSPARFRIVRRSEEALPPNPFPAWKGREDWQKFLADLHVKWGNRWESPR